MMKIDLRSLYVTFFLLSLTGCLTAQDNCNPVKLLITPAMIVNESRRGNAEMLFDEQELAGDPLNKKGGNPTTIWYPGWGKTDHPSSIYINLGNPAKISAIYLRDINNKGAFTVEAGLPGNWNTIVIDSTKGFQSWNAHTTQVTTQYLRFTRQQGGANVSEVVIYGCMLPDEGPPSPITDLRVNVITDRSIKVIWTATGDDGKRGSSSQYDIRYSASPIQNETDFNTASRITQNTDPKLSGIVQSVLIRGLKPLTTYYVAMKAIDESKNASAISNAISATTTAEIIQPRITMDKFIGTNAFIDDPIDKLQAVGFVREYHNWRLDDGGGRTDYPGYPHNEMKWGPSYGSHGWWDFDKYYAKLREADIEVSPVIQGNVPWLQGQTNFPYDHKPTDKANASTTDPNSYQTKAHHLFQFAARFGSTNVPKEKLTLAPDQQPRNGLGLVRYIEDWNEQNKYWAGPDAQFSPQEYAALASADYDGHANTMKEGSGTFGIKNADPKMKFVMGGLAGIDLYWIQQMQEWFENKRPDNKFVPDVINVHHYAWKNKNPQGGGPPRSPEEDDFKGRMKAVVDYRDQNFPNVEVWISEFGWDTNPGSPLCPKPAPPFDIQEVQGQWLVRAYLAFAAAGVDRAQMYMLRDVDSQSTGWYSSSGLTSVKDFWTPKKSWYYVYTLKNTLKNMVYAGEDVAADTSVLIYKFKDINSQKGAYVVWAKTKTNYTVKDFKLKLTAGPTTATKVELAPTSTEGIKSPLKIIKQNVILEVGERPVFVLVDKIE
ncbi:MAG TPA: hypothetical protein VGK59_10700 [Ohtaekwangia sp.]